MRFTADYDSEEEYPVDNVGHDNRSTASTTDGDLEDTDLFHEDEQLIDYIDPSIHSSPKACRDVWVHFLPAYPCFVCY
jgi:hypothetical protein